MDICSFRQELLPGLLALQHKLTPIRRHISAAALKDMLTDSARENGKNVRLVFEAGELAGYLAWVIGQNGEFFGAPFVTSSEAAAQALLHTLLEQAVEQRWVRVSAFPEEKEKISSLTSNKFVPVFEFIEFEAIPSRYRKTNFPDGVIEDSVVSMEHSEFVRLHNAAFAGVDNSLPIDKNQAKETLSSSLLDPVLSRIWRSKSGEPLAFSLGNKDGYLEAIGVVPSAQRKGIGVQLYAWILSEAASQGHSRIFSTVSSRNEGSLRLHRRMGIPEVERRAVWEKILRST